MSLAPRSLTSASPRSRVRCPPRWCSATGSCATASTPSSASPHRPVTKGGRSPSLATAPSPSRSASRSPPCTSARIPPNASACSAWRRAGAWPPMLVGHRTARTVDRRPRHLGRRREDRRHLDRRPPRRAQRTDAGRRRSSATRRRRWVPRRPASRPPSCTRRAGADSRRRSRPPRSCPPSGCEQRGLQRPDAWIGCDAAWIYDDVEPAAEFVESIDDVGLGWFEDVFPPGDAGLVRRLRERVSVPIAMGDEQGGSYYPEALLQADAVDVVRIDLTCMGGITGGRRVIDRCVDAGVRLRPAHVRPRPQPGVLGARPRRTCPIEWGVPWTGVDPYADSLVQPVIDDGMMAPLPEQPGFGSLLDVGWATSQPHDDPHRIFELVPTQRGTS